MSLRTKDEVQSAHFSGQQFTLHCAIVEPAQYRYHIHISDDTKHDPISTIIEKYDIRNENLWIQSGNATFQFKNKHAFSFYQKLSNKFNLRIIQTCGGAGHGKGVIDIMSRFRAKGDSRHDIVTLDVFSSLLLGNVSFKSTPKNLSSLLFYFVLSRIF